MKKAILGLLLTCLAGLSASATENSVLKKALLDELERSMNGLELDGVVKPYFLAYTVHTDQLINVRATKGGIATSNTAQTRRLEVQMRVGTPEFDNTNFMSQSMGGRSLSVSASLTLEDDYELLRKQIWLTTDRTYKDAVERYAAKDAAVRNLQQSATLDFSAEEPHQYVDERKPQELDFPKIRAFARELSEVGTDEPLLYDTDVYVFTNQHLDTYVNSEDSYFTRIDDTAFIRATAWTQADDGRYLSDYVNVEGRSWEEIADLKSVKAQVEAMHESLLALRDAEPLERYNGPVLFEGQAAAELVGQILGANLINYKLPVFENDAMAAFFNRSPTFSSLKERLGSRILPRSWQVYDDPTVYEHGNSQLIGGYPVDSDGIHTRRVTLVENGVLKTLLTDRNPSEDIQQSTGSNATGSGPSISNLFVEGSEGSTAAELKEQLLEIVEDNGDDFGLRIDRVANPYISVPGVPPPFLGMQLGQALVAISAYKVFPNGDEELVRHANVRTELLKELRNLPGYSASTSVHNTTYLFQGGDVSRFANAPVFISIITPDILIEDASINSAEGNIRSPPFLAKPVRP